MAARSLASPPAPLCDHVTVASPGVRESARRAENGRPRLASDGTKTTARIDGDDDDAIRSVPENRDAIPAFLYSPPDTGRGGETREAGTATERPTTRSKERKGSAVDVTRQKLTIRRRRERKKKRIIEGRAPWIGANGKTPFDAV